MQSKEEEKDNAETQRTQRKRGERERGGGMRYKLFLRKSGSWASAVQKRPPQKAAATKEGKSNGLTRSYKLRVQIITIKNSAELDDSLCATRSGQRVEDDDGLVGAGDDGFGDGN